MPHDNLPPTPPSPGLDPDFRLALPFFSIPDDVTLRMLMERERAALDVVNAKVKGFMEPGMSLLGSDGKPMATTGLKLNERLTTWMKELITLPTAAEEWVTAATRNAKEGSLGVTSWALAYMVYQEFSRILLQRNLRGFINTMDFAIVSGMNALHHKRLPVDAYKQGFTAKTKAEDGTPILEAPESLHPDLYRLQEALLVFLDVKGLVSQSAKGEPFVLTMEGVHLLEHLMAVMGCTESMRSQGPAIVSSLMDKSREREDITSTAIKADLGRTSKDN